MSGKPKTAPGFPRLFRRSGCEHLFLFLALPNQLLTQISSYTRTNILFWQIFSLAAVLRNKVIFAGIRCFFLERLSVTFPGGDNVNNGVVIVERIENLRWYFSLKGCKLRSAWARGQLKQLIPAFDIIFCMADSSKWSHFVKIVKFSMEREGRWCFRNKLLSFYFVVRCRCSAGLISVFSRRSRISRIHKKHFTLSLKSDSHKRWKAATTTTTYCQLVKDIFL